MDSMSFRCSLSPWLLVVSWAARTLGCFLSISLYVSHDTILLPLHMGWNQLPNWLNETTVLVVIFTSRSISAQWRRCPLLSMSMRRINKSWPKWNSLYNLYQKWFLKLQFFKLLCCIWYHVCLLVNFQYYFRKLRKMGAANSCGRLRTCVIYRRRDNSTSRWTWEWFLHNCRR